MPPLPAPIPMTPQEKEWLMNIYDLRRKDLFSMGFVRCMIQTVLLTLLIVPLISFVHDILTDGNWFMTQFQPAFWILKIILGILLAVLVCTVLYYGDILTYKQDAVAGLKQAIPYTISQKQYFPVTGQYFLVFATDDPDTHHEIDEEHYNSCEEGDVTYMYQAINSKHIFHKNDHIQVKFFNIPRPRQRNYYSNGDW